MAAFIIPVKDHTSQHESMDEGQAHEAPGLVVEAQAFNGFLGEDSFLQGHGPWSKRQAALHSCVYGQS